MSDKQERCEFCIPVIKDILEGLPWTEEELTVMRANIEVLGKGLHCDVSRLTCLPLLRIQKEIDNARKPAGA